MTYIKYNLKKHIPHASVCGRFSCHSCYACEAVQPLTATLRKIFERFWHPLHDGPDMPVIWANDHFSFFLPPLSLPQIQCQPFKKSNQPLQFFFPSHLVPVFFITIFLIFNNLLK